MSSGKITSRLFTIAFVALVAATSVQVFGQTAMPRIEERVRIAFDRIYDGIRMGDLTRGEAGRLIREHEAVRRLMRQVRQDGVVYKGERRDVRERLERLERDIDWLRSNGDRYR
ncbi:MAG: hypothetical protein A3G24_13535 [Betaproteobacteria bacterium RIFCSPLOWO2_12_FULL_62_13]|nr:MAG: hypothetical protein A3G24_13535 [Betaproteobacteria bacterium RIFCSPLOWO2_12_FULL_62_13]